jgi:probable phosphoglycerate mutase
LGPRKKPLSALPNARQPALYLLRHGETEWNKIGRFQGAQDSPLTALGRAQARALGQRLAAALQPAARHLAYVSPLGRARETAAIIAEYLPLDVRLEPRIAEVSLGRWEGMRLPEIRAASPDALAGSSEHDWYFQSPGGESFDAVLARVSDWLREAEKPAIVITHGVASRVIRGAHCELSKAEMLQLPIAQDAIYTLGAEG